MPWWRAVSASSASASACCWAMVGVSYETVPASRRLVHEYDVVAELFETADVVTADALGVATFEVVGSEVLVGDPACQHLPQRHDQRVMHGDGSLPTSGTS